MKKEFEDKIRLIHDYFHSYGLKKKGEPIQSQEEMMAMFSDTAKKENFITYVHEGYKIGQDILLEELIQNEKDSNRLIQAQKDYRRNGNKEKAKELDYELKKLKYKEAILRNLADSLAWLLMQRQHWQAKRWHSGSTSRPSLLNSNIESLHSAAAHFYKEHPNGFVLYTDLTSFIDIADLIVVTGDLKLITVEVKEGEKSKQVLDFIDRIIKTEEFKPEEMGIEKLDNPKKFLEQVERTIKQMIKGNRLINLINEEKGYDPLVSFPKN